MIDIVCSKKANRKEHIMKKNPSQGASPGGSCGGALLKSVILSYIFTAVLLLLISFIMYKLDPPETVARAGVILTYILSCFAGGFMMGKQVLKRQFLWGMVLGLVYFILLFIVSLLLGHVILTKLPSVLTVLLMCALGGTLGGMLS